MSFDSTLLRSSVFIEYNIKIILVIDHFWEVDRT